MLESSWHHTYEMPNGVELKCMRNAVEKEWHINVSYGYNRQGGGGGNIHNSGHRYQTLKEAKNACMSAFMAYFVYKVIGKWDRSTSFLERDWPDENSSLRVKSFKYRY